MPINRPDGRHWCDPASETPDGDGQWTCPGCGQVWLFTGVWETPEDRETRLEHEARARETVPEAAMLETPAGEMLAITDGKDE